MNQPPSSDDPRDEPARDAWLSEALRHAPDADAAPSVAVRETILRQARAAAASPMPPRRVSAWQRFNAAWSWISGPRVAAAFASVMVATVVGLMWWDRPMDEALRPVEQPATVTAPAPTSTPAPQPAPTPVPSPPAPNAEPPRTEPSRDLAAAAPPRATLERKREAVRPRAETSDDKRREAAAAPAPPRAADETRTQTDAPASARADKEGQEIEAARERRTESAQMKAAAPAMRSAPAAAGGTLYAAPAPAASPAPASPPAAAAELRQARPAPLGALLEALAEESPRWRWQRDTTGERALTPELQAWLQRLAGAVMGRSSNASPGQGSVQAPVQELRLLRDGGVQAIVRLGADGAVRIEIAGEAPLTARLPATSAAALRAALDDATR